MNIQSQNKIPTLKTMLFQIQYNSIITTYFVIKMQDLFFSFFFVSISFFQNNFSKLFFLFFSLLNSYFLFLVLFITISFSLLIFRIYIIISFFIEHAYFMHPTFGYCKNHLKSLAFYGSNVGKFQISWSKHVYFVIPMQIFHIEFYVSKGLLL